MSKFGKVGIGKNVNETTSQLSVNGSVAHSITSVTSNITLDNRHYTVLGDNAVSSADINITLPTASSCIGRIYRDWETDRKSTRLNSSHRL